MDGPLSQGELLLGPWEEHTCNYLKERRWEESSLECHLTGFPELGAISEHPKQVGQHRESCFSLLGKSMCRDGETGFLQGIKTKTKQI